MKKDKKAALIAPLLIIWAFVLYTQFFGNEAEATSGETVSVVHGSTDGSSTVPDMTEPELTPVLGIAPPEVLAAQQEASRNEFHRNPFRPPAAGASTSSDGPMLTAIIGRLAVIDGGRYRVGDEIPGVGTLAEIGRGWVRIEVGGGDFRVEMARKRPVRVGD